MLAALGGRYACSRCDAPLVSSATHDDPTEASDFPATPLLNDWELDGQLAHIARTLGTQEKDIAAAAYQRERLRFDLAQPWSLPSAGEAPEPLDRAEPVAGEDRSVRASGAFASTALMLGTLALVCGGVLLGWSALGNRPELWSLGLPIAVGGQIALLIGLLLQLERLWQDHRHAADHLKKVGKQLDDLKATANMLGSTIGAPSGPFYTHLAHGAAPEMLLQDLKGQIDILAMKMSRDR
ncbi:MAG: hypothetical protein ACOY3P_18890 [Planctomycetota bacterium]